VSSSDLILRNVRLADGAVVDVEIREQRISAISSAIDSQLPEIEGNGHLLLPGLVDLHTHLREPGKESSETVLSGSQAAVKGGYTAVSAMANTSPVADTAGVVEQVARLGANAGLCDVFPIGAVTVGLQGEQLAELSAMAHSTAKVRIFSDDGRCVSDPLLMRRALEYVKSFNGVIAQHAQDPILTAGAQMNEGAVSSRLGLQGWPAIAEESIIARDILLANYVKSRLHICHLTTKGGVEIVRWAKSQGMAVTAEVTPHHLLLTEDLAEGYDPIYKVNPPLRTQGDVDALREGLADGTIDIVATDHAPHPAEDKDCDWNAAAFGMTGLETSFAVVNTVMLQTGLMEWSALIERMSTSPAQIGGYADHGRIAVGSMANLIVVDPIKQWKVDRSRMLSRSSNTPFHDLTLRGQVLHTFYRGVHVLREGQLTGLKHD